MDAATRSTQAPRPARGCRSALLLLASNDARANNAPPERFRDDYSLEAFREKRLDYRLFYSPIELWGEREHVVAAVQAHNAAVRRLAERSRGAVLVDQDRLMPRGARTFNDPCHLTIEGSEIFARHLVAAIRGIVGDPP